MFRPAPDGAREFTFTVPANVLVTIQARDEQEARAAYARINGETFSIDCTTGGGHHLDGLTLFTKGPELYEVDGEEPVEQCPRPDCGGHLINHRCTNGDCYAAAHGRTFTFALAQVLAAAEHATAATTHTECDEQTEDPAHLCWLKTTGDGTCLASNGHDPYATHTIYADGWGPGTHPVLGDDDDPFHAIDLHTPTDDAPALLDTLRTATANGHTEFLLRITHGTGTSPTVSTTTR
ncbi:hypothetical protein ABZ468_53085 [Streptomyces sp. NPDC005708]|uniref:hypothetical protein n=1 Tax=Streptomyces sp. NPDC005708 TaxID=3154564 RepID=UPI0033FAA1BF